MYKWALELKYFDRDSLPSSVCSNYLNATPPCTDLTCVYCRSGNNSWDLNIAHIAHFIVRYIKVPPL